MPASLADFEKLAILPPKVAPDCDTAVQDLTTSSAAPATAEKALPNNGIPSNIAATPEADPSSLDNASAAPIADSLSPIAAPLTLTTPPVILPNTPTVIPAALPSPLAATPASPAAFPNNPRPPAAFAGPAPPALLPPGLLPPAPLPLPPAVFF